MTTTGIFPSQVSKLLLSERQVFEAAHPRSRSLTERADGNSYLDSSSRTTPPSPT